MSRLLPALALGLALVGCSRSGETAPPKPPADAKQNGTGSDGGTTTPDLDPAEAAAQDKAVAFVAGMKGKVKRGDGNAVTEVDLSFKPVADAELKELAGLKRLAVLNLAYTQVTDAGVKELVPLKNLTTLSLRGTKVTGSGFRALAPLKSLTTMDLRATHVSDAGLRELGAVKSLTSLDLIAIMGTVEGVNGLQRALPKCKIEKIQ
ncbi:leucine-rich repeat domain-containing protein [Gemmata sp.]|uniref:leucine-rich repeat domain-containing protein n=1 Tax=Gemmata sp. TaxID=1914242 RepID=UPI003F6EDD5C